MRLHGSILPARKVSQSDRDSMYGLMVRTYANVRRAAFDADLDAKRWVIQLRDPDSDELVGFSTQTISEASVNGRRVTALYSGDTVVDRQHWGDPALAHVWGNFALRLIAHPRSGELYWFLTSKGFRTYRFLPLFFREFYPRRDIVAPAPVTAILNTLGERIGGARYDFQTQIICADADKDYLLPGAADPKVRALHDPHVRYFLERNPGYARGDELCCLAPLTAQNFTRAAYRVIERAPCQVSIV
jgi:hypothetical protein